MRTSAHIKTQEMVKDREIQDRKKKEIEIFTWQKKTNGKLERLDVVEREG